MSNIQKLELTWIGKNNPEYDISNIEPRILEEKPEFSNCENDPTTENMIIHGDNLLALKALLPEYEGKIKCIYIDPPYNTGNAFEHYDDNVEHSLWLSLMKPRLELLKLLLSEDGTIFVQTDDSEQAYLKVLMDEVFGRNQYLNTIYVKSKSSSGASGGGEDKKLKKNVEIITVFKKGEGFKKFNEQYTEIALSKYIDDLEDAGKNFAYTYVLFDEGVKNFFKTIKDGKGEDISIFKHTNYKIKTVSELSKELNTSKSEIYKKYIDKIFTLENAQTSIRDRVLNATDAEDNFYSIEYFPISGKNKGKLTSIGFMGKTKRLVSFLKNTCVIKNGSVFKRIKIGTLWDDLSWSSISFEGDVSFPSGKKPEILISRIIDMSSVEGDFVLDSFLGSGTTSAVAQKMNRNYIGIEMGEQSKSHCKLRLDKVIDGTDQSGISKLLNWKGGGAYKFYELAPSFITNDEFGNPVIDSYYNDTKLIKAICKLGNFTFKPSQTQYWIHGTGQGNNYIYVTTQILSIGIIEQIKSQLKTNESLTIYAKKFEPGCQKYDSKIIVKKIPQAVLNACQFGKKEYLLPIKEITEDVEFDDED